MNTKHNILCAAFAAALLLAVWLPSAAAAEPMMQMEHITTLAQAEALKPGDLIAMTCSKCKSLMIQQVNAGDSAHVKMMTVGEKLMVCSCGGTVEVVPTGKGEGKNAELNHVCSHCGEGVMYCCATKPGSGAMKNMIKDQK